MLRKRTLSLVLIILCLCLTFSVFYHHKESWPSQTSLHVKHVPTSEERFLSYFPHGGLMDQLHSFQNGLRIAQDTNRTLLVPYLRLGRSFGWADVNTLARQYEAMDKAACQKQNTTALRPKDGPNTGDACSHLAEWSEVPWSMVFDLSYLQHHRVRFMERPDHDWKQVNGKVLSNIVLVDPKPTLASEGSLQPPATSAPSPSWLQRWWQHLQHPRESSGSATTVSPFSGSSLTAPDGPITTADLQRHAAATLIQCGSLVDGTLYHTTKLPDERALLESFNQHMLPDHLPSLKTTATKIAQALGGPHAFLSLHLHLRKLLPRELELRTSDFVVQQPGTNLPTLNINMDDVLSHQDPHEIEQVMRQLGQQQLYEMAQSVVLQLTGDIPIAQAVSGALPVHPSTLATYLSDPPASRRQWLQACVDYRRDIDPRYPIVHVVTDLPLATHILPFWPLLLDQYPCTFTRQELIEWNLIDRDWSATAAMGLDPLVDYNQLLAPLLDMLVASQAYSVIEAPTSLLSKLTSRYRARLRTA
ncbi:hypothetical protein DM01DRAFT_1333471 [Hesseltinella vesiculosa]|uniref:Uncharacterized protein n=1 Tax=Hesseltinella vesiculosa TaxID=101127 RepID=A0A1X2GPY0_9FUNG|nr:hypothetical protein DM01DRAFT_1333471 [Hesseltinella vesiculosa]